jgi:cell division septum initiation protein DivIVA
MRGYDRDEVDQYINRVNRILAELQITAAPESAIRHALDEVSEETRNLLQSAHETAEEITRRSRSQADDRVQGADREARELREAAQNEARELREAAQNEAREIREAAEARVRELEADVQRILEERASLIDELRELARRLGEFADGAQASHPTSAPSTAAEEEPA